VGLLGVVGLSGFIFAHDRWNHSKGWSDADMPTEYRLTQEQAKELTKIRTQYTEKLRKAQRQAESKQIELDTLWSGPSPDMTRATELRRQILDLEYRMDNLWLEANSAASGRLTPEQREYFGGSFDVLRCTDSQCNWNPAWNRGTKMMGRSWHDHSRPERRHTCNCGHCW
jgi:Spy/CpxP family protein refolding chaperone